MDKRIIQYYEGELSNEEKKQLLQEVSEQSSLKQEMMDLQHVRSLMAFHPNEQDKLIGQRSWQRFYQLRRAKHRRKVLWNITRYAAVLIMGMFSMWWIINSMNKPEYPIAKEQKLMVPIGHRAQLILPDGTKVWLNAGSTLTYPSVFNRERKVTVVGEAFFDVAKSKIPFIVSMGKIDVKALGTRFDVSNYPSEEISVSLIEGSVKIYHSKNEENNVILKPGQQLKGENGEWLISETSEPILWQEEIYIFQDEPLAKILKKLERYYDVKFKVADSNLLQQTYTGKFRHHDGVIEILRVIQKICPFKVARSDNSNEIVLYN